MIQKQEKLASLPGVWATLAAGFELTTKRWWLLLVPVLLDLFLWLGPRLSFQPLIEQLVAWWPADAVLLDPRPMLELVAPRTNLFTSLSVAFLGVPALMNSLAPERAPFTPPVIEIATPERLLALGVLFTVLGLLLAATFYSLIGRAVIDDRDELSQESQRLSSPALARLVPRTWLRFLGLAVLFLLLFAAITVPVSLMVALVSLVSQQMAAILALSTPVLFFWTLIFLSYSPQGLVLAHRPFFKNVWASVRLLQVNLMPAISLLLVITLVNRLLKELLLAADDGSWLTLASILGHAFVTTAMLAATFIFYRDRYTILFADETSAEQTEMPGEGGDGNESARINTN
jgi:hypothetical protein